MRREGISTRGAVLILVVLAVSILTGCSWRPDRNAAQANLKNVKSLGADLGAYYQADPRLDSDGKRIKNQKIERAVKLAEKMVEVSR